MKRAIVFVLIIISYLVLYAVTPEWDWAKQLDYPASWRIATDSDGNIYIAGDFIDTAEFGTTTLTSIGKHDLFVAKMDSGGNWLWAIQTNNKDDIRGFSIDIDNTDNIVVTGSLMGTCKLGNTTLTCAGDEDLFVAKLDKDGNWLWATQAGGDSSTNAVYTKTDNLGNIFISGKFQAKAAFGDTIIYSAPTCYISKLDNSGNWLWTKRIDSESKIPHPLSLDGEGNLYFSGNFSGTVSIADSILSSSGLFNSFVAKLDTDGKLLWLARNVGEYGTTIWSIATDKEGNSYITGNGTQKIWFGKHSLKCSSINNLVAKLDKDGNWLWAKKTDSKDYQFATCITLDNDENPVITGNFSVKTKFGPHKLVATGEWDMFIAKLDHEGKWLWAIQGGGNSNSEGHTILIDKDNNAIVAGLYYNRDLILGSYTLPYTGYDNENFLAKLRVR